MKRSSLILALALMFLGSTAADGKAPDNAIQWATSAGGNGHYYIPVSVPGSITWTGAKRAAEQVGGYLVTITSKAENDFVFSLIDDGQYWNESTGPWIGGYQPKGSAEPAGGWRWVTDEPFSYSNWQSVPPDNVQPNNFGGVEDSIHFGWGNRISVWNDKAGEQRVVIAYVIEFDRASDNLMDTQKALVLHFDLDDVQPGGKVIDKSGKGNHGQTEGAKWTSEGKIGGCYLFDKARKTDRILIADHDSLDCTKITLATWIKTKSNDENWNRIIDKNWIHGYNLCLGGLFEENVWNGKPFFERSEDENNKKFWIAGQANVADGKWHHIAGTYNGYTAKIYVDGIAQRHQRKSKKPIEVNNFDLAIGNNSIISPTGDINAFDGWIDEVRIYNRALNEIEIEQLYPIEFSQGRAPIINGISHLAAENVQCREVSINGRYLGGVTEVQFNNQTIKQASFTRQDSRKIFIKVPIHTEGEAVVKVTNPVDSVTFYENEARGLLADAKGYLKLRSHSGYTKCVRTCRTIIRQYPNSRYSKFADRILKKVPAKYLK